MGWTSSDSWTRKSHAIAAAIEEIKDNGYSIVAQKIGKEAYFVVERDNKRLILIYIFEKNAGEWAFKDMDESSGPFCYNCPKKFFDLVPNATNPGWRQKCLNKQINSRIISGDPGQYKSYSINSTDKFIEIIAHVKDFKCCICNKPCNIVNSHYHQGQYIGDECCWDERLKSSE